MEFKHSPVQQTPESGTLAGFNNSPFMNEYYHFELDGQFDFDFDSGNDTLPGHMTGKAPGASSSDGDESLHDKRSHPGDGDGEEEGGGKRREGEEKTSKKPGRKPLTSEPTSKRKAQNRAAQRAFRERKEKHLKDLEIKVQDLEKASESANHENSILRAQIDKMSAELREYKKKIFLPTSRSPALSGGFPPYFAGKGLGSYAVNGANDINNFQFDFPKFGSMPSQPAFSALSNGNIPIDATNRTPTVASANQLRGVSERQGVSPPNQYGQLDPSSRPLSEMPRLTGQLSASDMSALSGLFSPSILENAGKRSYDAVPQSRIGGSRTSTDSSISGQNTSYSSPSASLTSNNGRTSSGGTSPEPYSQSPSLAKPSDNILSTIGEERCGTEGDETLFCEKLNAACGNPETPVPTTKSKGGDAAAGPGPVLAPAGFDFDWFARQNGNQFDPVLFGDYRDPQDNLLLNDDCNFFNDALALPDVTADYTTTTPAAPPAPKADLLTQIDAQQNSEDDEASPADSSRPRNCSSSIWCDAPLPPEERRAPLTAARERLQTCPRIQDDAFDLNDLCSKLTKQAKCSETGAAVNETNFRALVREYARSDGSKPLDAFAREVTGRNVTIEDAGK